jgi:hypothetical protein
VVGKRAGFGSIIALIIPVYVNLWTLSSYSKKVTLRAILCCGKGCYLSLSD